MIKKITTILFLLTLSIFSVSSVYAEEKISSYSVSPLFSEHQSEGIENFFDIKWTPSSKDEFSIKITNNTDKEQTYKVEVNKARTNKNGIVDYSDSTTEDKAVQYKLTKMIDLSKEVKVPANSSKNVIGSIVFPEVDFNGILMAGIHVSENKMENSQSNVSNSVAYNIPFVVRGNIEKRPNPTLDLTKIIVEKFSSDTYSLDAFIENKGPNLMKEVKISSEINDESGKNILKDDRELDITPETSFVYPVKLPSTFKAGKYTLTLNVKHNDTNKWEFSKDFEITKQEVKKFKKASPGKISKWIKYGSILTIILILLIGSLSATRILKKFKNKVN